MSYGSAGSFPSSAFPVVGCDAWANIRVGNDSLVDSIVSSVGFANPTRISPGYHGLSFSVPTRYGGGGYALLFTPEVDNHNTWVIPHGDRRTSGNGGPTAAGNTAGIHYTTVGFNTSNSTNSPEKKDFNQNNLVHMNVAAFAFKTTNDLYDPYVANLIPYSEDLTQWSNIISGTGVNPVVVSNVEPNPVTGELNADKVTLNIGATSAVATNWSILSKDVTFNSDFKGVTGPNGLYTWSFWAKSAGGAGKTLSIRGAAGGAYTHITLTTDWKRYSGTEQIANDATTSMSGVHFTLRGGDASGLNESSVSAYIWGVQVEPGSLASPYVKTEATYPVYGNQDAKKRLFPGASGLGLTGATYGSATPSMLSSRSATAYGTIVIPPAKGGDSVVSAYIENSFNVTGVSAGANSTFDISFKTPMNNGNYCVLLSAENEAPDTAINLTADKREHSMLLVSREKKDTSGFRVISLKQDYTNNTWTRQSHIYQSGLKERIHFIVFGGGTYGQP